MTGAGRLGRAKLRPNTHRRSAARRVIAALDPTYVALPVALGLVALLARPAMACEVPDGFARLATPQAEIAYRWEPRELKVGQFFAAEVIACRSPAPGAVGEIVIDAQMPAHGHGMNYRPSATPAGPGRFRFTGLMLHMPGTWRLTFDLLQGDRRTRLTQEIELAP